MLVLSRQIDEKIVITTPEGLKPSEVIIQIVDIRGDKVRVGLQAPKEVLIDREEVHIEKKQKLRAQR